MPQPNTQVSEEVIEDTSVTEDSEFSVGEDVVVTDEERRSRAEKKRERGELRKELDGLRDEIRRRDEEIRALASRPVIVQAPSPQSQPEDPDDAELNAAYEKQRSLMAEFNAKGNRITAEEVRDFEERSRKIEEAKYRAIARKEMKQAGVGRQSSAQEKAAMAAEARWPEVMQHQTAKAWARVEYQRERDKGSPDSWETLERVMEKTRAEFGMSKKPAPTDADRRRYTSVSRAGGVGGKTAEKFVMTDELKKHADKAFPHIKDAKARYQKWVNECSEEYMRLKSDPNIQNM